MTVLFLFCTFIFRGTILAKRPPNTINLKVKLQGKFRYKKEGNKITPVEMVIKGKKYRFIQQDGKWGIKAPLRDLMQSSPECKQAVNLAVGEVALVRIRDMIKGNRTKAQKLVKDYKALKKMPVPEDLSLPPGPSNDDFVASAGESYSAGGEVTQNSMSNAYNQMLNNQAFLYPAPQPGIGGWDLVSEEEGGTSSDSSGEEDEGGGFFSWLSMVICVLVVIIAPIVAAVWLAGAAITLAAVTTAFLGMIGAIGVAGIVGATFNAVDDVINGRPLIEIWN